MMAIFSEIYPFIILCYFEKVNEMAYFEEHFFPWMKVKNKKYFNLPVKMSLKRTVVIVELFLDEKCKRVRVAKEKNHANIYGP